MHKTDFVQAINSGFGSGGMFCTLSDGDLGTYLLTKVMKFMELVEPRMLQAVGNVGQQDVNPPVFILSPEVRVTRVSLSWGDIACIITYRLHHEVIYVIYTTEGVRQCKSRGDRTE